MKPNWPVSALVSLALLSACAHPGNKKGSEALPALKQENARHAIPSPPPRPLRVVKLKDPKAARLPMVKSFGAMDLPLGQALQMLLTPFGFALDADETVDMGRRVWVLPFTDLDLFRAVKRVLVGAGYACEVDAEDKVVHVSSLETRTWRIPLLNLVEKAVVVLDAGSDKSSQTTNTAGGSKAGSANGLTGARGLSLRTESVVHNPWKDIEKSIKGLLSSKGRYLIDRVTGTLTVTDSPRIIKSVDAYIKRLVKAASRQVGLEVSILEVSLSDEYQAGVDWSKVAGVLGGGWRLAFRTWGVPRDLISPEGGSGGGRMLVGNGSVSAIVAALSRFGKVRVAANPRLRVLNNSTAQLFVGESTPYLSRYEKTVASDTYQTTVETGEVRTGLALSVTPAVDERGMIRLSVAPVLSDLMGIKVFSPAEEVRVSRPLVKTREMRTHLLLAPRETAVMGGLMMERRGSDKDGIPFLQDVPFLGAMFRMEKRFVRKVELVISIRPTLLSYDHGKGVL